MSEDPVPAHLNDNGYPQNQADFEYRIFVVTRTPEDGPGWSLRASQDNYKVINQDSQYDGPDGEDAFEEHTSTLKNLGLVPGMPTSFKYENTFYSAFAIGTNPSDTRTKENVDEKRLAGFIEELDSGIGLESEDALNN